MPANRTQDACVPIGFKFQPLGDGVAVGGAVGLPARVAVKVPAPRPTT